jgi:glycogen debranching enzyme
MDAAIEGKAVTPRSGKAVEIQALWYNALKINQLLADKFKERNIAEKYDAMTEKAKMSFEAKFWNKEKQCLFDVVEESSVDRSLRPNQIIAAALDFRMLGNDKNKQIVEFVQREFLTPFGLRTLSRSDPRYRGNYEGDARMRDQTYHNGTIWPWLTGPFTTAFLKANGYSVKNRQYAYKTFIQALFEKHIYNAGLGTISEIFDGDAPNKPRGCVAQAWSVAEPFRAYIEDIMQKKPAYEKEVFQV